jgi:hypothetical protein
MAVSTTTDFNLDIDEIIQDAFEHLGGPANTGQDSRTARRSLNLLLTDWSNRGILLWKTDFTNQTMAQGTASYSLAEDVVAVTEAIIRRDNQDIEMDRISMEEYLKIPDKTTTGRPIQFSISRYLIKQRQVVPYSLLLIVNETMLIFMCGPLLRTVQILFVCGRLIVQTTLIILQIMRTFLIVFFLAW